MSAIKRGNISRAAVADNAANISETTPGIYIPTNRR